jgi:hypothetical protein
MDNVTSRIAATNAAVQLRWHEILQSDDIGIDETYNVIGALARAVFEQSTDVDLCDVFNAVELELVSADQTTRSLLIVGFIEDLQNISLNRGGQLNTWIRWLGPTTLVAWREVEQLWSGSISPADFNKYVDSSTGGTPSS